MKLAETEVKKNKFIDNLEYWQQFKVDDDNTVYVDAFLKVMSIWSI